MIEEYIKNRTNLTKVFLLIDYRHKPMEDDIIMYDFLKYYNLDITIIATKYDNEYKDDIRKQLAIMSIQSFTNSCDNIKLLHKRRIFKTEEEVKKLIEEIKEKNNEQFVFENEE